MIGKLATQVKASKLTDYELTKKLLMQGEINQLQDRFDRLRYGKNDSAEGGDDRGSGPGMPGSGPANICLDEDVLKTSFVFIFRRRLDQDEYVRLSLASSEDVLVKTNIFVLAIRLQDVFKTFSKRLQDVFKTSCQDIFKTFSRRLQDVLQKRLQDIFKTSSRSFQDVFKTYYQVKMFLVTQFQDIFETYSKGF